MTLLPPPVLFLRAVRSGALLAFWLLWPGVSAHAQLLAAGGSHSCVRTAERVACWGRNFEAQVGDSTSGPDRLAPATVAGLPERISAIDTGWKHTCVLTQRGGVKCWGLNQQGQLGNGGTSLQLTATDVTGLTSGVTAIAAGGNHTCALLTSGGVKCWGNNAAGQVGDGIVGGNRLVPTDVAGLTSGVVAITAGEAHTCARTTNEGVKCWGDNQYGQLGNGTRGGGATPAEVTGLTGGVTAVAAGGVHTCALLTGGAVTCWGANSRGQLGNGTTTASSSPTDVVGLTNGALSIALGSAHTCALTLSGLTMCWGDNARGQLGDGTKGVNRTLPVEVVGLTSAVALAAGSFHTCALSATDVVTCWGLNANGQLGDGTTTDRLVPTRVIGLGSTANDAAQTSLRPVLRVWPSVLRGAGPLRFTAPVPGPARLTLLDVLGRPVRVLFDGPTAPGRVHEITLGGDLPPAGAYFVHLRAGSTSSFAALTVLR